MRGSPNSKTTPNRSSHSTRKKLWHLDKPYHCSVIGTCLSLAELQQVTKKYRITVEGKMTDYKLHSIFVNSVSDASDPIRYIQKLLDKKYSAQVKCYAKARSPEEFEKLWVNALESGDVAGSFWALVTNPHIDSNLLQRVTGEVHMLSHISGASTRNDIKAVGRLRAQKQIASDAHSKTTASMASRLRQKESEIETLKKENLQQEAHIKTLSIAKQRLDLIEQEGLQSRFESLTRQLEATAFKAKQAEEHSTYLAERLKKYASNNEDLQHKLTINAAETAAMESTLNRILGDHCQSSCEFSESDGCPLNNLTGLKFLKYPFNKSIGIHSITEDYFEQEVNSMYCKNGEFIEKGEVIGLLNFEKEITGDIVQGLPRIEELLEARKKKPTNKHLATNQKKSLLIQKTSIDSSFEFQKLGTTIKENDKINPHNLLKIYFNYYGIKKQFFSSEQKFTTSYRLVNNYEASYRTFKKIQLLILNAVQSVYQSQGVSIANKHLEVIIKQMTTKVLITHEGHTPLLPREVVDLYHIQYINQIIEAHNKRPAYYVPLLLGITKAALNNPSFISAASFQETTRVLTKAAIEGRVDWLRGLKENIIIGHLIPSGTGYQSYTNCFNLISQNKTNVNIEKIKIKI